MAREAHGDLIAVQGLQTLSAAVGVGGTRLVLLRFEGASHPELPVPAYVQQCARAQP